MDDRIILVVDDEPNVVQLCRRLLEKAGFQVIAVTSPSQALAILSRQVVNLLLVDIRMPGLDGFHLLQLARRQQPDLASVIMTGFGTVEMAISALRQGADGLILKPFDNQELVQTVQSAISESERRRDMVRLRSLHPLFNITEAIFSETDLLRLQELILDLLVEHLNCSHAGLYQLETESNSFKPLARRGEALVLDACLQARDFLEPPETDYALISINREAPGRNDLQAVLLENDLDSLLCTEFTQKNNAWLLLVARQVNQSAFSESDREMFLILTRQAGLALENARLYEELRTYVRELEVSRQALKHTEKMVTASRLTASIAHEINNPLQSLNNCLHLAGRKELSIEERERNLQLAQSELDRLMTTVRRMLEFYRPGVREQRMTDVNELLRRVTDLLEPELSKGAITVSCDLSPELPLILAVPDQIQQVFFNLILNSMEAMPEGGEILITTGPETGEHSFDHGSPAGVEIYIQDTGPGIPEAERENLFEPFVSSKEHGTGLGLAVSYGIITAHGGKLDLLNGSTKGACFRIVLPKGEDI